MSVTIAKWRCWSCKHEAQLNLPHDHLPSPRCEKCNNAMLAVARHQCSRCDAVYGEGNNKPIRGWCSACWEWSLAQQRANAERIRARGLWGPAA